ncbi:MAG: hypothetical protein ACRDZO_01560 [Egibacteraceae bacterium]
MTQQTPAADALLKQFEGPWRDDTPVFGCCRKAVAAALADVDPVALISLDATARVRALREAIERTLPGHLAAHRCCSGHLADLAFDLPDVLALAEQR